MPSCGPARSSFNRARFEPASATKDSVGFYGKRLSDQGVLSCDNGAIPVYRADVLAHMLDGQG